MGNLIMSKKEREQLKVFEKLVSEEITQVTAAQLLKVTPRWVRKKLKRYRKYGDAGIVHKSRGCPSPRRWAASEQVFTIDLLKSEWQGFGPTFVSEKLKEFKGITVSNETVRKMMIANGLWTPGRRKQSHRKRRDRKLMKGVLVQLDGSPHDWFEGRAPRCTLLVFIDDATSQILWLEFVESESFKEVADATKKYIENYGRPVSFYVDYGAVFSVNLNNPDRDKTTQFERIMKNLDIDVIHASSPQAKGRVERCNKTMQDRLVKEMRLAGIASIEEANIFVQKGGFIARHSAKFAVPAAQNANAHRPCLEYDLHKIFCSQEERIIANDFTISYKGKIIQLTKQQSTIVRPKNRVTVCEHLDGKMTICIRNKSLNFQEIGMRKRKLSPVNYVLQERDNLQAEVALASPFEENFKGLNQSGYTGKNRNFSCC